MNRLGRTRDAKYWYDQLVEQYPGQVLPPVHLRAAIAEAAAQSLPIHGLGTRAGAPEAAAEFDALLAAIVPPPPRLLPCPRRRPRCRTTRNVRIAALRSLTTARRRSTRSSTTPRPPSPNPRSQRKPNLSPSPRPSR